MFCVQLVHNFSNLSWVHAKDEWNPVCLGFVCILPALTELVTASESPSVDSTYSAPCLVFCTIWKEYDQSYLGYVRAQVAILIRYGSDPLWLHTPYWSRRKLFSVWRIIWSTNAWRNPTLYGMVLLVGSAILNYDDFFLLYLSVISSFQATLEDNFRKLAFVSVPRTVRSGSLLTRLRRMSMAWPNMAGTGWWCSCLAVAILYYSTMFFISWRLTISLFLDLPHRLDLFLVSGGGLCWAKFRKQSAVEW